MTLDIISNKLIKKVRRSGGLLDQSLTYYNLFCDLILQTNKNKEIKYDYLLISLFIVFSDVMFFIFKQGLHWPSMCISAACLHSCLVMRRLWCHILTRHGTQIHMHTVQPGCLFHTPHLVQFFCNMSLFCLCPGESEVLRAGNTDSESFGSSGQLFLRPRGTTVSYQRSWEDPWCRHKAAKGELYSNTHISG